MEGPVQRRDQRASRRSRPAANQAASWTSSDGSACPCPGSPSRSVRSSTGPPTGTPQRRRQARQPLADARCRMSSSSPPPADSPQTTIGPAGGLEQCPVDGDRIIDCCRPGVLGGQPVLDADDVGPTRGADVGHGEGLAGRSERVRAAVEVQHGASCAAARGEPHHGHAAEDSSVRPLRVEPSAAARTCCSLVARYQVDRSTFTTPGTRAGQRAHAVAWADLVRLRASGRGRRRRPGRVSS